MKDIVRALLILSMTAPGAVFGQTSWCNKGSRADVVRVILINCGEPKELNARQDGDDNDLVKLKLTGTIGIWEQKWPGDAIDSKVLCSNVCGFASDCKHGTPAPEKQDGQDVCVAQYEFRCAEQAWTLIVRSDPPIPIDWTRKRSDAITLQRGAMPPGTAKLCDLADDEEIMLKPKLRPTSQFSFRDIGVKRGDLQQQKQKTLTLGPNDLVRYVIPPAGRRTQPLSDIEKEYLKQALRELILAIAPEVKEP